MSANRIREMSDEKCTFWLSFKSFKICNQAIVIEEETDPYDGNNNDSSRSGTRHGPRVRF